MAKMLMGQIDHARTRIAAIKVEKCGVKPKFPERPDSATVLKEIRAGDIVVKPTQLRQALENFINRTPVEVLQSHGGSYNYRIKDYEPKSYAITETVRGTLGECLVDVVTPATFHKDLETWKAEDAEYRRRRDLLNEEATSVEDAIVLGDNAAALAALQAFAAFEV